MKRSANRTLLENAAIVVPVTLAHSAIYRFLTHHGLSTPQMLDPTLVDRQIPFMVWMVWPYLMMVVICIVAPLCIRNREVFRRLVVSYATAVTILVFFYLVFPTTIQRQHHQSDPTSWSWFLYRQFTQGLGNACAFPSGHIVFPMIGCWALFRDNFPAARLIAVLTALFSVSILSIKEHVFWDWVGGVVVGVVSIVVSEWWSPSVLDEPVEQTPEHIP